MSDQDDNDHTRITPLRSSVTAKPSLPPADKTRIAAPPSADDKTKIAPPPKVDDKTRLALKKKALNATAARQKNGDKTRIAAAINKPASATPPDATQFTPSKVSPPKAAQRSAANIDKKQRSSRNVLKNRFVLEKVIGSGGMGVVYKAKDLLKIEAQDRNPYVAIKVLSEEFKSHPEAFIALQRESRKSQSIAHPNIVNVHDFDKDRDTVFMTMEFLDGQPLDQLIRQYKATGLPSEEVYSIIRDISAALIHAHGQHVVHSDFKPGNIFVTKNGTAKVFDFGIARAVANAEAHEESHDDKTVFDAGNLGALTPAYASLEMLEGETPDVRDDVYALGCIAYELYTGEHPYNRVHANEACRQKLKPQRISTITKNQWKAIESALAFKRRDRMSSVAEFWALFAKVYSPAKAITFVVVLLLMAGVAGTMYYFQPKANEFSKADVRTELEYEIRLELVKANIKTLLETRIFSERWENDVWVEVQSARTMLNPDDEWLVATEANVLAAYIQRIEKVLAENILEEAQRLILHAQRYTRDQDMLAEYEQTLLKAIADKEKERAQAELAQKKAEQQQQQIVQSQKSKAARNSAFESAYKNVKEQLVCQGKLDMRDLEIAIEKLRSISLSRYRKLESPIVTSLSNCIAEIGLAFPDRAKEIKRRAMRLFASNQIIANTRIIARDPCSSSIAGLGARGKRAICRDNIAGVGNGPSLVVVPAKGSIKSFAIGKYEITVGQLNQFCTRSDACTEVTSSDSSLPATNITITIVNAYLKWLNRSTDKRYRLPSRSEWLYAAKAGRGKLDPNRNCQLSTRGIEKGGAPLKATVGAQNGWGLVNQIGNASEWVTEKGGKLSAVGGSYATQMQDCNFDTAVPHDGSPRATIGFRVLREIDTRQ